MEEKIISELKALGVPDAKIEEIVAKAKKIIKKKG